MARPITDILRQLRQGIFIEEASTSLRDCVAAVEQRGGSATLTIQLTVKKAGKSGTAVVVSDKISTKLPGAEQAETLLFAMDGELHVSDPRQSKLELRAAPAPDTSTPPKVLAAD